MKFYKEIAKYYDQIAAQYGAHENAYDYVRATSNLKSFINGVFILEVGCGTGNLSIDLARSGYTVVGMDSSQEMLNEAKSKLTPDLNVKFYCQDIRDLDLPYKFETIIVYESVFALIHTRETFLVESYLLNDEEITESLRKLKAQLKAGGRLIIDIRNPRDPGRRLKFGKDLVYRVEVEQEGKNFLHITHMIEKNEKLLLKESVEKYIFPLEKFEIALEKAGFEIVGLEKHKEFFIA